MRNNASNMCVDSAVKPDDLQGPVGLWPCHNQGGNQVLQIQIDTKLLIASCFWLFLDTFGTLMCDGQQNKHFSLSLFFVLVNEPTAT